MKSPQASMRAAEITGPTGTRCRGLAWLARRTESGERTRRMRLQGQEALKKPLGKDLKGKNLKKFSVLQGEITKTGKKPVVKTGKLPKSTF
ncbi:hypothetical protein F2Q68_00011503 [Brassica cretica]|uniref:Uncharacterized protein n=1 Tax=Brassica cretica TaxID=69181 RepID=A0A8S9KP78_BRACR|nr:hypothetical protein F2Q68_00011503 [Brassica cretica]